MVKLLTAESRNTQPLENTGIPGKGSRLEDLDAEIKDTFRRDLDKQDRLGDCLHPFIGGWIHWLSCY
jgi:hypothetical protein